ncbi:MAG: enoyl-CoA hydratase/isomerase family protein, partial [Chloroflexi bacterium]|nr:enoyl-CoA hydratase/isomerase family protein [Chloroflexota bacterium]
ITINRPEVRNALTRAMSKQLRAWFEEISDRDDVRVVVIRGAGDQAFCAGHDLKELASDFRTGVQEDPSIPFANLCVAILSCKKPTIAAVRGYVRQAGVWISNTCDLLIAAENANFALTALRFGNFPVYVLVPIMRRIGRSKALDMLLTADVLGAAEAKQIGMVDRLVPVERFDEEVQALASKIASRDPQAVKAGKEALSLLIDADTVRSVKEALLPTVLMHLVVSGEGQAKDVEKHLASVRGTGKKQA